MEGSDHHGGADVVVADFIGMVGFDAGVPETEHASEVVAIPLAGFVDGEIDELIEAAFVDAVPLIEAVGIPTMVGEGVDVLVDVGTLEALTGE